MIHRDVPEFSLIDERFQKELRPEVLKAGIIIDIIVILSIILAIAIKNCRIQATAENEIPRTPAREVSVNTN